ncbi:MAG TPA: formimidoylglutamase [Puia sp.]|jgi:formiminoglutamase|nr:formimidoylglutamase [Puia sp.]
MPEQLHIIDYLDPVRAQSLLKNPGYKDGQIGKQITVYEEEFPDLSQAEIVLIGCDEQRGAGKSNNRFHAPDAIREQFYQLFSWQGDLKIADAGNVKSGALLSDTYAALKMVLMELMEIAETVVILGGSHDLTLAQYNSYGGKKKVIEATCVDALIDLNIDSLLRADNFLMEMLTDEPNYIRHYNHIGFQSYYVHPHMLETMDKLRFDCFRTGNVKENIEEMEPVIRNSNLFSFDISAISNSYAPANSVSPNGFNGEEACTLMRYAGLSPNVNTIGIYGYQPEQDRDNLTAKQISHMLWYFMEGKSRGKKEAKLGEKESFLEFHTAFAEVQTTFLQSKKTNRWWMQLPDKKFIACSFKDYLMASTNEIPERWLRAQERGE